MHRGLMFLSIVNLEIVAINSLNNFNVIGPVICSHRSMSLSICEYDLRS